MYCRHFLNTTAQKARIHEGTPARKPKPIISDQIHIRWERIIAVLFRFNLPEHCPCRSDKTVHEGCRDISPFPYIPAGRVRHGEFTDPNVDKSEKSDGAPDR